MRLKYHSIHICTFIAGILALVGCGSKLTDDQKARFADSMGALGNIATAGDSAANTSQSTTQSGYPTPSSGPVPTFFSTRRFTGNQNEMVSKLSAAIQSSQCQVTRNAQGTSSLSGGVLASGASGFSSNVDYELSFSGAQCPIKIDLVVKADLVAGNSLNGTFHWDYAVQDPTFVTASSVDQINLDGDIGFSGNKSVAAAQVSGGINIQGTLHSTKEGAIQFYANLNLSAIQQMGGVSGQAELKYGAHYPDFSAEARIEESEISGQAPVVQYYLNSESVSASEFQNYFFGRGVVAHQL